MRNLLVVGALSAAVTAGFMKRRQQRQPPVVQAADDVPAAVPPADGSSKEGWRALGRLVSLMNSHPWVVVSAVVLLVVFRVLVVARGDMGTMHAILVNGGITAVTTLVLTAALPTALMVGFATALVMLGAVVGSGSWKREWKRAMTAVLVMTLFALLVVPLDTMLVFAVACVLGAVIMGLKVRFWAAQGDAIGSHGPAEYVLSVAIGLCIGAVVMVGSDQMWSPPERISVDGVDDVVVGYVWDDGANAVVLQELDRSTLIYPSETILDRQRCQLDGSPSPSLLAMLWWTPPQYVGCSD